MFKILEYATAIGAGCSFVLLEINSVWMLTAIIRLDMLDTSTITKTLLFIFDWISYLTNYLKYKEKYVKYNFLHLCIIEKHESPHKSKSTVTFKQIQLFNYFWNLQPWGTWLPVMNNIFLMAATLKFWAINNLSY